MSIFHYYDTIALVLFGLTCLTETTRMDHTGRAVEISRRERAHVVSIGNVVIRRTSSVTVFDILCDLRRVPIFASRWPLRASVRLLFISNNPHQSV